MCRTRAIQDMLKYKISGPSGMDLEDSQMNFEYEEHYSTCVESV